MKKLILSLLTIATLTISCKNNKSEEDVKDKNTSVSEVADSETQKKETANKIAICVYEGLSVRNKPSKEGKWLTKMSLGEKITYLQEDVIDSLSKKSYSKIKLTDGKEGWTQSRFIVIDGKVGVLVEDASVYRRPDLLTKTDKKYSEMDIIAIQKVQDDWMHVKGKRSEGEYVEEGWIKSSNISNSDIDIATAKFTLSALSSKGSMSEQIEELQKIVNNSDLSSSKFIPIIEEKIKDLKERNQFKETIEESTEE